MITNECDPIETRGHDGIAVESNSEKKIVCLTTGAKITVRDAIWSADNTLLKLQLTGDGIDATVPREHIEAVIKTQAGEEVILDE